MAYLLIYKPPKPAMLPLPAADGDDDKHGSEALQLSAAMDFLEAAYARYLAGRDYASALVVMQEIVNTHAGSVRVSRCHHEGS